MTTMMMVLLFRDI